MKARWALVLGAALALFAAAAAWSAWRVARVDVASLARRTPRTTALMAQRAREAARDGRAYRVDQRFVPYERISPLLRRAVLVAEDDAFFSHGGLDWNEMRESARRDLEAGRIVRGGSTITQQLAKNLWLSSERSVVRKLEEIFLALRLERALSKRRIFELYLNLIEWGDGVYGVEAASRRYFGLSASDLDARQAVLLAAVIINPRRFSVTAPSGRIERRARKIASRLRARGFLDEASYRLAIGEPPPPPDSALATPDTALFAPESAAPIPRGEAPAPADSAAADTAAPRAP